MLTTIFCLLCFAWVAVFMLFGVVLPALELIRESDRWQRWFS